MIITERQEPPPLEYADLVLVDDILPSDFSPFRTIEYAHYLRFFNAVLLSLEGWQTWIGNDSFDALLERLPVDPVIKGRIAKFRAHTSIVARLAYVTFLGNAARLMPYFESRRIPFILQLYPGGGFEIDNEEVDVKLRRVLTSALCRKVIVTQKLTESYIIERIGCDPAKIKHIFGGVFESRLPFSFDRDKAIYPRDKATLDVCFVAHKYDQNITAKGYDKFVSIALQLVEELPHIRFHVVGDYLPDDVALSGHRARFEFYGRRSSAFLRDFYRSMDAIISINRPFDLTRGSFDGFPTGACIEAGLHGVLNCINDPLNLNPCFSDGQDIVLLDFDHQRSASRLNDLLSNPSEFYRLAEQSFRKFHEVFDTDRQLWERTQLIAAELTRHEALIIRPAPDPSALDGEALERARAVDIARVQSLEEALRSCRQDAQYNEARLQLQVAELAAQLDALTLSTSWRLTRPLRHVLARHPRLARIAKLGLKAAWWMISLAFPSRYIRHGRVGWQPLRAASPDEPLRLQSQALDADRAFSG